MSDEVAPVSPPRIQVVRSGGEVVVMLSGDHDLATVETVRIALVEAARAADRTVTVDLRDVTFMDASIVGALVTAGGPALRMRRPSSSARRVLEACDLIHLVSPNGLARGLARSALETFVEVPLDIAGSTSTPEDRQSAPPS